MLHFYIQNRSLFVQSILSFKYFSFSSFLPSAKKTTNSVGQLLYKSFSIPGNIILAIRDTEVPDHFPPQKQSTSHQECYPGCWTTYSYPSFATWSSNTIISKRQVNGQHRMQTYPWLFQNNTYFCFCPQTPPPSYIEMTSSSSGPTGRRLYSTVQLYLDS